MQFFDNFRQKSVIFECETFGKLKRDKAVFNVELVLYANVVIYKIGLNCGNSRNVDRHGIHDFCCRNARGDIFASLVEYESVDLADKSVFFENRQEHARRAIAFEFGVVPADKNFAAVCFFGAQIVFWLIEQVELVVFERAFHLAFDFGFAHALFSEHVFVEIHAERADGNARSVFDRFEFIHAVLNRLLDIFFYFVNGERRADRVVAIFKPFVPRKP